ncbi:MAG: T9SS type A sorting domain-containing protein [Bacteroidota bacterium]
MKQPNLLRPSWQKLLVLSFSLSLLPLTFFAQGESLADRQEASFRLNLLQNTVIEHNGQKPPYFWSGVYLRNAFSPELALSSFRLDSSYCGIGVGGSQSFGTEMKAYYAYDSEGQLSEVIFKQERPGPVYENFSRKLFSYVDGNRSNYLYQKWNMATNSWQDDYEEISTYNSDGIQESFVIREVDMGQWQNIFRERRILDTDGNVSEVLSAKWENNAWLDTARKEINYNDKGFFTTLFEESWNGNSWDTLSRESAIYGDGGMSWEGYRYEEKTPNGFQNVLRESYGYDMRGYYSQMTLEVWDAQTNAWIGETREAFEYNRKGIWIGWKRQDWTGTAYEDSYRQQYQTNSSGRLDIRQIWDVASNSWIPEARTLARYDSNFNLREEIGVQVWDGNDWVNGEISRRCLHFWSEESATSVRPKLPQISCELSNPYRSYTPIRCDALQAGKPYQVRLSDMQGRLLLDQSMQGGNSISIDKKLPQGVYNLNIYQNQQIRFSKKLLIRD